jgi:hypothetical protein
MDRIRVTKGALPPSEFDFPISVALSVQRSNGNSVVSWPLAAGNVVLQSSPELLPSGMSWTDVSGTLNTMKMWSASPFRKPAQTNSIGFAPDRSIGVMECWSVALPLLYYSVSFKQLWR